MLFKGKKKKKEYQIQEGKRTQIYQGLSRMYGLVFFSMFQALQYGQFISFPLHCQNEMKYGLLFKASEPATVQES